MEERGKGNAEKQERIRGRGRRRGEAVMETG